MLLNSGPSVPGRWGEPQGYNTETLLDNVSKQMAASNLIRRHSRGASGQKGPSMRITKTGSTGASPRNSMLNRRRTVMTDSPYRRKPTSFDHGGMAPTVGMGTQDGMQPPPLANRPVSWHASSHLAPHSTHMSPLDHSIPKTEFYGSSDNQGLASTPMVYSSYASPSLTFSPLSQPFSDYRQPAFHYTDDSFFPNTWGEVSTGYTSHPPPHVLGQDGVHNYSTSDNMDPSMYSHFNWDNFAANGFDSTTAPPTPENFLPIQQPDPSFEAEEAIPYHALEDSEPGEVLVGMGLYDAPEKSPDSDPHLDNYRALMISQLLGTPYRKHEPPATGKGLKLEETWNPPPSDDEDDGDSDEDAEGSEADESSEKAWSGPAKNSDSATNNNHTVVDTSNESEPSRDGWL